MKLPLFIAALALTGASATSARADSKADVDAFVKAQVGRLGNQPLAPTLAADAAIYAPSGAIEAAYTPEQTASYFLSGPLGPLTVKLTELTVVVDDADHVAWFHGLATATATVQLDERRTGKQSQKLRVNGVAVDDHGWKIAVEVFTQPISDRELLAYAKNQVPPVFPAGIPPALSGDATLAAAARGWFTGGAGFAKSAGAPAALVANGTAPAEYAKGAATAKLAKAWDKLKLGAVSIDARVWGSVGFVRAGVRMPVKKTQIAADLTMSAIAQRDASGAWRWVSLNWTDGTP